MKKKITFFLILVSSIYYAQSVCGYSPEQINTFNCLIGVTNDESTIDGAQLVNKIIADVGLPDANFIVKPCRNINNALATIHNQRRFILFDEAFLHKLAYGSRINMTYLFILAHEIGHHFNGHTLSRSSSLQEQRKRELDSDRFAGFILQKNGAQVEDLKNAILPLGNPPPNSSHPQLVDRINAAISGYNEGISQTNSVIKQYRDIIVSEYENYRYAKSVSEARTEIFNYYLNGNKQHLKNSIKNYLVADNTRKDPIIVSELASAYRADGDYRNTQLYYESAYDLTRDPYFILASWEFCKTKKIGKCSDYEQQIEKLNENNIKDYNSLRLLARFYDAKYLETENPQFNLKASNLIQSILDKKLYTEKESKTETAINYINTLNDMSINYNRVGKVKEAYALIREAYKKYDEDFLNNKYSDEETRLVDTENFIQLLLNKALYEMRLEKWLSCLNTLKELDKFKLDDKRKSNYHFYKGRSFLGTGKNEDAIIEFSRAISLTPDEMVLYYYRGKAKFNLPDNKLDSWSDVNISCNGGFSPACDIINSSKTKK